MFALEDSHPTATARTPQGLQSPLVHHRSDYDMLQIKQRHLAKSSSSLILAHMTHVMDDFG